MAGWFQKVSHNIRPRRKGPKREKVTWGGLGENEVVHTHEDEDADEDEDDDDGEWKK